MQICTRCVLDERYPGIRFDEEGICNYCRNQKSEHLQQSIKSRFEDEFMELINRYKGKNHYDCLVAYSGGKDSSYTLYLLKTKYNLNILALTYDNWFQSEQASQNIREIVKNLNIFHLTVRPNYDIFKSIIRTVICNDIYSKKALERASSICTTCISLIRFMCLKVAIEEEIPMVVFGMSPGQAPLPTSIVKTNAGMVRKMQDLIYRPLHNLLGDIIAPCFLEERHLKSTDNFPYSINPLAFMKYEEKEILELIQGIGWRKPEDTDANSTNCLLNALANQVHIDKFGYNPYSYEMAELLRKGHISREIALQRLNMKEPEGTLISLKKELGISQ